jgi:hypothetical protein
LAQAAEIRLAWDPPTNNTDGTVLTDLAGFKLVWGTNSGAYTSITNVGNTATSTVASLTAGTTYFFAVRAYNVGLAESSNSVELAWLAPLPLDTTPPVIQTPAPVTLTAGLDDKASVPNYLTTLIVSDDRSARTNLLLSQLPIAGYQATVGATTVVIAATDEAGNRAQVNAALTILKANRAPVVDAGPDVSFRLDKSGTLFGMVTDDGLPTGASVVATWSKLSGPGSVTLGNTNAPSTTVWASVAGTYVLQLQATDQLLAGTDSVMLTVLPRALPGKPDKVRVVTITPSASSSTSTTTTTTGTLAP